MRIAVISDIHGNGVALDAVLADLRRDPADHMVCLGDMIQGGPQPAEVAARLRDLGCPVVMGNADDYLLTGADSGSESLSDERRKILDDVRLWSLDQLTEGDRAFIAQFQPTVEIPLGDRRLLCFHGSPASYDDIILPTTPEADFMALVGSHDPCLMAGGHTHMPQIRRIGASDRFFFNPGSAGLAYSHQQPEDSFRIDPWAEYALLSVEGSRVALEFRRVPFDVDALAAIYRTSGRPHAGDAIRQYGRS